MMRQFIEQLQALPPERVVFASAAWLDTAWGVDELEVMLQLPRGWLSRLSGRLGLFPTPAPTRHGLPATLTGVEGYTTYAAVYARVRKDISELLRKIHPQRDEQGLI
jgi:hypothetical protein